MLLCPALPSQQSEPEIIGLALSPSCQSRSRSVCVRAALIAHRGLGPSKAGPSFSHSCRAAFTSEGPGPQRDSGLLRPAPHFAFNESALLLILFSGFSLRDESRVRLRDQEVPLASPSWVWHNRGGVFPWRPGEQRGSSPGTASLGVRGLRIRSFRNAPLSTAPAPSFSRVLPPSGQRSLEFPGF